MMKNINLVLTTLLLWSFQSLALSNTLVDVQQSSNGDNNLLHFVFDEQTLMPEHFFLNNPSRLVLDMTNTKSMLPSGNVEVNSAAVKNITIAETPQRLRAIIHLNEAQRYNVKTISNELEIAFSAMSTPALSKEAMNTAHQTLNTELTTSVDVISTQPVGAGLSKSAQAHGYDSVNTQGMTVNDFRPITDEASDISNNNTITNINFRRGFGGSGQMIIEANRKIELPLDTTSNGLTGIAKGFTLPSHLAQTIDVTDFGTPVKQIKARNVRGNATFYLSTVPGVRYKSTPSNTGATIEIRKLPKAISRAKQEVLHPMAKNKNYTGKKITLKFQDIEVRPLLQLIGDFTGQNIVASDAVSGSMSLQLENVPWDQALDIILSSNNLSQRKNGNIIYIAPTDEITNTEQAAADARAKSESVATLMSDYIQVNYAKAKNIAEMLKNENANFLSERGSITVDDRTNKLLIRDTATNISQVQELVEQLDIPIRQVMIEARIVVATSSFTKELGSRFGVTNVSSSSSNGQLSNVSGAITGSSSGSSTSVFDTLDNIANATLEDPARVVYPGLEDRLAWNNPAAGAAIAMTIMKNGTLIDMELSALEATGDGEIVSSPRIMTSNNQTATIEQGVEIPYEEATSSGATSITYKKAVLSIEVTPQITPDNRVNMQIKVSKDSPVAVEAGSAIQTRRVDTTVLVGDNETLVLGGIYEVEESTGNSKVPGLGDIPIVGRLFSYENNKSSKNELLVFVTPRIIKQGQTFGSSSTY